MAYLTLNQFKEYIGTELTGSDGLLRRTLNAAEADIDAMCGRSFTVVAADSVTHTYVPDDHRTVTIHDLVDDTNLAVTDMDSAVDTSDLQLEPTTWTAAGRPYYRLRRLNGFWLRDWANPEKRTISVTSTRWGWEAVPAQVFEALEIHAKDLAHMRQTRFGVAGYGDFGPVRLRDNPIVRKILAPLVHPSRLAVA